MDDRDAGHRINVLLLLEGVQLRGSFSRAKALLDRIPADCFTFQLLTIGNPRMLPSRAARCPVRVSHSLNWPMLGRAARLLLAADLKRNAPDLIDIQHRSMHAAGAWLARRLKRPYLVTVHDYLRPGERFVIDSVWCRQVVAVSESVRTELIERTGLSENLVSVIPSGVEPPHESQLPQVLHAGRCPVIGTAGPLESGKGLHHFLQAAARVLQSYPDAIFVIAGSGPEEKSLRRLAAELQLSHAVTILPNLHDFGPALDAMDLFVLPSLKQGLGSTMLDAMARGLPVIGTESGGVYSLVADGVTGLLVPPSDEAALAEHIVELLRNPEQARQLGAAGRQRVLEHFHVTTMVDAVTGMYRRVTHV